MANNKWDIRREIALMGMPQNVTSEKSLLVQPKPLLTQTCVAIWRH